LEKESIMERYAVLLEEAGSAECQEALNDRDFGVAHETVRERHFLSTFLHGNDHLTKTGSGQT
jgi:hypothetical protein